jgi:hypothetical protein
MSQPQVLLYATARPANTPGWCTSIVFVSMCFAYNLGPPCPIAIQRSLLDRDTKPSFQRPTNMNTRALHLHLNTRAALMGLPAANWQRAPAWPRAWNDKDSQHCSDRRQYAQSCLDVQYCLDSVSHKPNTCGSAATTW